MTRRRRSEFDLFGAGTFRWLDELGVRYLVIGGLAVIAVGEPRTTADVDVIAFVSPERALALIQQAVAAGFEVRVDVEQERLSSTGTLRFGKGAFQLDVIVASLPFEDEALARATRRKLFGHVVNLPTPEDLILLKVLAGRDKDLLDVEGILRRHGAKLDLRYIENHLRELCDLAEDMTAWQRFEKLRKKLGV